MSNSITSIRFAMEPLRAIAFGAVPAAYNVVTGAGALIVPIGAPNYAGKAALQYPARQYIIRNETNVDLYYSLNGVDDHDMIVAITGFVNDVCTNQTGMQSGFKSWAVPAGTIFYVRYFGGVVPISGEVTLALSYGGE